MSMFPDLWENKRTLKGVIENNGRNRKIIAEKKFGCNAQTVGKVPNGTSGWKEEKSKKENMKCEIEMFITETSILKKATSLILFLAMTLVVCSPKIYVSSLMI